MTTMSAISEYLTMTEAAERIGVSYEQCTRYVAEGKLPFVQIGQQKLILEIAVESFQRPPRGNPAFLRQKRRRKKT